MSNTSDGAAARAERRTPRLAATPGATGNVAPAGVSDAGLGARPRQATSAWGWARRYPGVVIGGAVLVTAGLVALLAPWLAPHPPELQYPQMRLAEPGSAFILGGDNLGRDVLSRLIYASRVSLLVGMLSMLIAVIVGVVVGSVAGYAGGWADRILMRLTDLVLVFPTFFLLVFAVATFGRGITLLTLVIGLTAWPTNARVVRALMLRLRREDFVTAARVVGVGDLRIVVRHLVPQLAPIIIASATIRVAANILAESGLSYLGLGVGEPTPSWGNMVSGGVSYFRQAWWLVAFPGGAIFLVVLAFNLVGEGVRDLLDPRTRSRR